MLPTRLMLVAIVFVNCVPWMSARAMAAGMTAASGVAGKLADGTEVKMLTLRNRHGMQAKIIEYGATLTELMVPDRQGKLANVVLGSDQLDAYVQGFPAASVIGRYANRIRGAKFLLDGQVVQVSKNAGENHIHGGKANFSKVVWSGSAQATDSSAIARLTYRAADGEEGFPGALNVTVTYSLNDRNELKIVYEATTDKPTVINLTNHAYFNLKGTPSDVLDHRLELFADKTTLVDKALIPTGEFASVVGTPLDFRQPHRIGERIEQVYEAARGYDHNYIINGAAGKLKLAARVLEPTSGRIMTCSTTEPGVQLYTANGFNGKPYPKHGAFCLETQHFPDSPNHPNFPSTRLLPSEKFYSETLFAFSVSAVAQ